MNPLVDKTKKIKKLPKCSTNDTNYICGACSKSYKSYPALYLHIKRKHDGIRPADTRTTKPITLTPKEKIQTGRPQKPSHNIDDINQVECEIEELQNDLFAFLGENLECLSSFEAKPKLEEVVNCILKVKDNHQEENLTKIKDQSQIILSEIKKTNPNDIDIHIDFEEIKEMPLKNPEKIISWFILWLGRYSVKTDFISDLCLLFSKVIKILSTMSLDIQDLDNKLVWNNVMKESEALIPEFIYFKKNKELIFEFIKRVCHLIGKTFETISIKSKLVNKN